MSGGEAVLLDLDPLHVNSAELASGSLLLQPFSELDGSAGNDLRASVSALLQRHVEQTGSELAADLLQQLARDPQSTFARFTRLIPRDYARVLEIRERARDEGIDPDGDRAWSQILEATRG